MANLQVLKQTAVDIAKDQVDPDQIGPSSKSEGESVLEDASSLSKVLAPIEVEIVSLL